MIESEDYRYKELLFKRGIIGVYHHVDKTHLQGIFSV